MPRTVLFSYFFSPGFLIFWWLEFMGSVVSFWANVSVTFLLYNTVSAAQAGWLSTSHCFQFWNTQGISFSFPRRVDPAFQGGNSRDVKASNLKCLPDCLWVDAFVIHIRGPGPRQAPCAGWVSPRLLLLCNTLPSSHSSPHNLHSVCTSLLSLSHCWLPGWCYRDLVSTNQCLAQAIQCTEGGEVIWHSSNMWRWFYQYFFHFLGRPYQ